MMQESAIGLLELQSVAIGLLAADGMVKRAPVALFHTGTVHPGKFLVLVGGEVASVEEALEAGRELGGDSIRDELFLPDVDPRVLDALQGARDTRPQDAVGIVETQTVASLLRAMDRGIKGASVELREIHLADDLGGKAYGLLQGELADVEEAVDLALESLDKPSLLVARAIIPRIHLELLDNLAGGARFAEQLNGERP